uniref:hypothetical protein n=1 Tax=Prevotellamassilia timonensis TaxID=1852370 RepID=UPI004024C28F
NGGDASRVGHFSAALGRLAPISACVFFSAFEVTYNLPQTGCTDTKKAETDALPCVRGKAFCFRHYNLASGYVKARISTPFRVSSLR